MIFFLITVHAVKGPVHVLKEGGRFCHSHFFFALYAFVRGCRRDPLNQYNLVSLKFSASDPRTRILPPSQLHRVLGN